VTSREPLHVDGEWEVAVDPLEEQEAVELFVQRAAAVRSDVAPNGEVAEICRRLDCLPLAVELAAARAKALSLPVLLERLDQRLPLLAAGSRSAPERQRTLRATIAWSHDLLMPTEQALFARLAVFVGGCELEAAEEICGADVDSIASLVDKSLLRRTGDRYWMLETIREFAAGQLDELSDRDNLRDAHAAWYTVLGERAAPELHRGEGREWARPARGRACELARGARASRRVSKRPRRAETRGVDLSLLDCSWALDRRSTIARGDPRSRR
jgi:predicted ATPase